MFNEATTFREMLLPSLPIKYTCSWWRLWTLNRQAKLLLHKIFEIRIFSDSLNFFHSYLIYFYTHGISFPENTPCPNILAHLKRSLKDVSQWAYVRDFVVHFCCTLLLYSRFCCTLFCCTLICCIFCCTLRFCCNLTKVAIWCKCEYFPHIFRRTFHRQLWTAAIIKKFLYFEKQSLAKKTLLKISRNSQENTCVRASFSRDSGRRSKFPLSK